VSCSELPVVWRIAGTLLPLTKFFGFSRSTSRSKNLISYRALKSRYRTKA
jgi:hypothetical protein